jgi:hypothetical protein
LKVSQIGWIKGKTLSGTEEKVDVLLANGSCCNLSYFG